MSASLPSSSLTICSRNRPQLLLETVESVLQGDDLPTEIVIVDQSDVAHPSLATLKPRRPCEIRYLRQNSVGVGRARNAAIAAAQHDIVLLTDDDVLVSATWCTVVVQALVKAGPRAVVTGRVLQGSGGAPGGFAPSLKVTEVPEVYEGRVGKDVLYTGNMAMYRSACNDIGLFDERLGTGARFPAAYDNDFGFRLLEARYRIIYVPDAVVYHRPWRSEADYLRLRWNYGRGQGAFYAKHLSLRDTYMLRRMVRSIIDSSFKFVRQIPRQRSHAYGHGMYVLGILIGAAEWLLTQRKTR